MGAISGTVSLGMDPSAREIDSTIDGSALCRECGLCCDWSIFRSAALQPSEVEWAVSRRLPLLQNGKELSFALPCVLLEAREGERVCGDYEHRPAACRAFECKVLTRYQHGELSRTDAFAVVRKARTLVTRVEQSVAGAKLYQSFSAKLDAVADGVGRTWSPAEPKPDTGTLLDLGALRSVVQAFHEHRAQRKSHEEDVPELLARATDAGEWERLLASVGGDALGAAPAFTPSALEGANGELRAEGYTRLGPVLGPEEANAFASIVSGLAAAGWPAVFVFMHARAWEIPLRFAPWLKMTLGEDYELLSAVWAWHITPGSGAGWRPHRERSDLTVGADGAPQSLTIWIALTNATPDNGCVYLLPPAYDAYYGQASGKTAVLDIQNVRAVPAAAGVALAWNHQVLHWGGRSSSHAGNPRISLAFEFRRAGTLDGAEAINRRRAPSFGERLTCIAAQILRYERFGGIDERFVRLASKLAGPRADAPPDARGVPRI